MSEDLERLFADERGSGVDRSNYAEPSEFPPPVPRGKYTLQRTGDVVFGSVFRKEDKIKDHPFVKATQKYVVLNRLETVRENGEVTVVADDTLQGRLITFQRIFNMPFPREGKEVSSADDYLIAVGSDAAPQTNAEYRDALLDSQAEGPFTAIVDWEAFCKQENHADNKPFTLKGQSDFPQNGDGVRIPKIECPKCAAELNARNAVRVYLAP